MLGRMGRDASSPLAIQISGDSIRVLQLSGRRGRTRVSAWAVEGLDQGTSSLSVNPSLEAPLGRAIERCGSRQRKVVLALSASQVMCKRCSLPAGLSDDAIERQVLVQAEQLFPIPLDDLALDFQVLGRAATPGQVDVLVAACRQQVLDPLEQLCAATGLELAALEVDSLALQRLMPAGAGAGAASALLELEVDRAVLHRWPDASAPLHQQLVSSPGSLDEGAWGVALERALAGAGADRPLRSLYLAGAHASTTVARQLSQTLDLPCELLPWHAALDLGDAARRAQASGMALPYSLALGALR